jgi:hypothetical protein
MNGADATFDKPEEERTCKTKDLEQCPESAPGGLSLLILKSFTSCAALWQHLTHGSLTCLLILLCRCRRLRDHRVHWQRLWQGYGDQLLWRQHRLHGRGVHQPMGPRNLRQVHVRMFPQCCGCRATCCAPMQPLAAVSGAIPHAGWSRLHAEPCSELAFPGCRSGCGKESEAFTFKAKCAEP